MASALRMLTLLGVVASVHTAGEGRAWALKLGVVDRQQAMESLVHFKKAQSFLESEKNKRQASLESAKTALEAKQSELQAKQAISEPGALAEEQQAFLVEAQELSNQMMASQQELSQLEARVMQQLLERVQFVIQEVAREKDLDFVFDEGTEPFTNVLFHQAPLDLTDAVVAKYRARFKDQPLKLE